MAILGPSGLTFECASLTNNVAPDIDVEKGSCDKCKQKAVVDEEDDRYCDILSWQPGYRR
jgi:hypothetical protein